LLLLTMPQGVIQTVTTPKGFQLMLSLSLRLRFLSLRSPLPFPLSGPALLIPLRSRRRKASPSPPSSHVLPHSQRCRKVSRLLSSHSRRARKVLLRAESKATTVRRRRGLAVSTPPPHAKTRHVGAPIGFWHTRGVRLVASCTADRVSAWVMAAELLSLRGRRDWREGMIARHDLGTVVLGKVACNCRWIIQYNTRRL